VQFYHRTASLPANQLRKLDNMANSNGTGNSVALKVVGLVLTALIIAGSAVYAYGQLTGDVRRNCADIKLHALALEKMSDALQKLQVEQARTLVGIEQILKRLEDRK
jgi:hypothetical protein